MERHRQSPNGKQNASSNHDARDRTTTDLPASVCLLTPKDRTDSGGSGHS